MQIKEGGAIPVEEIVAVTMGPESAVRALHKAVSLGADRSVHLTDAGARRLRRRRDRLRAREGARGASRPTSCCSASSPTTASATRSARSSPTTCKMPSLTQVIKMDVDGGALRCERQAEYGYDTVQVQLPAVISVGDAINEPRYPSLKAIMGAKKKPLDTKGAGDVGIDGSLVGDGRLARRLRRVQGAAGEGRRQDHRGRGHERDGRADRRVARRKEADLDGRDPGLRAPLRGRVQQELARRRLRGREARRRAGRRRATRVVVGGGDLTNDLCATLGGYGAKQASSRPRAPRASRSRSSTRWRR